MNCERCQISTKGYELHDYCAKCSRNLCESCLRSGCCGVSPALSGHEAEHSDTEDEPLDRPALSGADFDLFPTPLAATSSRKSTDARIAHGTNKRSW